MRYPFIFGRMLIFPITALVIFTIYGIAMHPQARIGLSIVLPMLVITLLLNIFIIRKENTQYRLREAVQSTPKNNVSSTETLSVPLDNTLKRLQHFSVGSYIGTIIFSLILWFIFGASIINALTTILAIRLVAYIATFAAISAIVFVAFNADSLRARPILKSLKGEIPTLVLTPEGIDIPFILLNELDWYNKELHASSKQSVHVDWVSITKWQIIRGYRSIKPQYCLSFNKKILPLNKDTLSICSMDFKEDEKQNILGFAQQFLQAPMKWM